MSGRRRLSYWSWSEPTSSTRRRAWSSSRSWACSGCCCTRRAQPRHRQRRRAPRRAISPLEVLGAHRVEKLPELTYELVGRVVLFFFGVERQDDPLGLHELVGHEEWRIGPPGDGHPIGRPTRDDRPLLAAHKMHFGIVGGRPQLGDDDTLNADVECAKHVLHEVMGQWAG